MDYNMFKEDHITGKGAKNNQVFTKYIPNQEKKKDVRYVVTHPPGKTILKADDLVFVLAQSDPSSPNTWDEYNEPVDDNAISKIRMDNLDDTSKLINTNNDQKRNEDLGSGVKNAEE